MKADRVYSDYLQDMLDACLKAINFISDMSFEEFAIDEKTQFAVIRALEIIGEASEKDSSGIQRAKSRNSVAGHCRNAG